MLLLSLAGVVVTGFFLLAELLTPNESPENLARDLTQTEKRSDSLPKPVASSGRTGTVQSTKLSTGRIPEPDLALQQREEDEKDLAQERAEAEEEAREQAHEDAEEREDEEEGLNSDEVPTKKEALDEFLTQITPENWRQARAGLISAYKDGTLPKIPYVEDKFWNKVGEVGGQKIAEELLNDSDPAYTKILGGWGKADPQALLDYYLELDLKDPEIQKYLERTNNRELPFLDQFSSGVLDGLVDGGNAGKINDDQLNGISEVVDYFLDSDPMKGESMMREFTERVIQDRDLDALKEWVSGYEEPELEAATAQRVIESGAFDEEPLEAVEFANSLASDKAKRTGLSSAYARLASGMSGHDPNLTAQELNAMQNGFDRDFALNGFAHGLVHSDPDAALQWANSISNDNFRKVVTKNISKRIKLERPEKKPDQK